MIGSIIGIGILFILLVGILFINLSPEFGGKASKEDIDRYKKSNNYEEGKFVNLVETSIDMSFGEMLISIKDYFKGVPNDRPDFDLPVEHIDSLELVKNESTDRLVWFGHSAFLLQLDGKTILIDPMLGDVPAPHPLLGGKRYSASLPIEIEKLPQIDIVLISHDHYDHLDYGSIQKLKGKTNQFLVPLGVGNHLKKWGIEENRVEEFDWWQKTNTEPIEFVFTPSRHFSGRGLTDRNKTLWGSWVIKGKSKNLFFSGDSGYGTHFKEIGKQYGPFDFAMMECGQYNEKWAQIHMMPEETAQASVDVNAKVVMPIHWGAFTLALHSWTDPVERVTKKLKELNQSAIVPLIGEEVQLESLNEGYKKWWLN